MDQTLYAHLEDKFVFKTNYRTLIKGFIFFDLNHPQKVNPSVE